MYARIVFPQGRNVPRGKLAEAEIVFEREDGLMAGTILTGFTLWEGREGGINVTVPGRQYTGSDGKPKTYNYLRGDKSIQDLDPLKEAIIEQYHIENRR